ncbi:MAG: glycosyltransferase [Chloroflexi bacterium]|nr:glycosyltransferase [Chloroflexota bacterium]
MRILTLIHEFPPIGGGGGRAAYDICCELAARGHAVTVLTAHMDGLPREEIQDGIRLVRIPSKRTEAFTASFETMFAFDLAGLWAGLALIWRFRPDVIHTHFAVPAGALAFVLSLLTGVPYILTAHLGDVPGGVPEKTAHWFKWLEPFTRPDLAAREAGGGGERVHAATGAGALSVRGYSRHPQRRGFYAPGHRAYRGEPNAAHRLCRALRLAEEPDGNRSGFIHTHRFGLDVFHAGGWSHVRGSEGGDREARTERTLPPDGLGHTGGCAERIFRERYFVHALSYRRACPSSA